MTTYKLTYNGKRKSAHALVAQMQQGKAGETLVKRGFGKDAFCAFLADITMRAIDKDYDEAQLAALFRKLNAGNASAASKSVADATITIDDEDPQSLNAYWKDNAVVSAPDDDDNDDL